MLNKRLHKVEKEKYTLMLQAEEPQAHEHSAMPYTAPEEIMSSME